MDLIEKLFYLSGIYPLARGWLANRATSLTHALSWAAAAWLAWFGVLLQGAGEKTAARYFALCLTSCAGIAVLGARRPIVGAWNFVLVCLLAVLLLPCAENALLGKPLLDPLRLTFIVGTIAVGVLNYLPTRMILCVLLVGTACAQEIFVLLEWRQVTLSGWLLPAACWTALLGAGRRWGTIAEFDRQWLTFRDRFGLMWGQRIREQFNRAAANASWPVILRWSGLRKRSHDVTISAADEAEIVATLQDMLKRFGPSDHQ